MFKSKSILITGGTGSFGTKMVSHFLNTEISEIRIFSRDEKKQEDMRLQYENSKLKFYVGDVRDYKSISNASKGVDYIFHAAALKQVPSCEFYPNEALKTNVLGAENVMNAANSNGVGKVILLSTDKAVYPINAMGITKALMEKFMLARSRMQKNGETIFCATRYGNVMASRGSVIPLFIDQALKGKDLTLTDPEMTRFLMSLDDSVNLVMHAFGNANQGDIFIQKSPSCTLGMLAKAIIDIFNPGARIKIIGTRHGEKLYESLVSREEMARAVEDISYFRVPLDDRDLNYSKYFSVGEKIISDSEDYSSHNTKRLNLAEVKDLLLSLDYVQKKLKEN